MIDIVIPLGTGSVHNNLELQYCLKSIERNLTGYRHIWIIGEDPGFEITGLTHEVRLISAKDHGFNIQDNIRRKVEIACKTEEITYNFFFTNDDNIFLKPLNVNDLPYYYSGNLELAYRRKRKIGSYKAALLNTWEALEKLYYAPYHFDIHVPIIYNKKLFLKVMEMYPWATCKWGFVIKSLYCNTLMIRGEELPDLMIGHECKKEEIYSLVKDRFVFSFNSNGANEAMFEFLKETFDGPATDR